MTPLRIVAVLLSAFACGTGAVFVPFMLTHGTWIDFMPLGAAMLLLDGLAVAATVLLAAGVRMRAFAAAMFLCTLPMAASWWVAAGISFGTGFAPDPATMCFMLIPVIGFTACFAMSLRMVCIAPR